jgi:hypothetical protein
MLSIHDEDVEHTRVLSLTLRCMVVMKSSKFPRGDLYSVTIIHDGISIAHSSQSTSFDNLLMSCLGTDLIPFFKRINTPSCFV